MTGKSPFVIDHVGSSFAHSGASAGWFPGEVSCGRSQGFGGDRLLPNRRVYLWLPAWGFRPELMLRLEPWRRKLGASIRAAGLARSLVAATKTLWASRLLT